MHVSNYITYIWYVKNENKEEKLLKVNLKLWRYYNMKVMRKTVWKNSNKKTRAQKAINDFLPDI